MTARQRIQRRRTTGWTAPFDEQGRKPIYVGRGTKWGNPSRVVWNGDGWSVVHDSGSGVGIFASPSEARRFAAEAYRHYLETHTVLVEAARRELAGRDLMCWCAPDMPCHADVLLDLANSTAQES